MFIGHLPAGYITSKLLYPRFSSQDVASNRFIWAGVLGAIAPDLDMVYFYLVDHRQHHHHTYITHYPIIWLTMLFLSILSFKVVRNSYASSLAVIFSLNGLIHMLLDSIVGDIWWFAPLAGKPFAFFTVPALHTPWWLSFIFHWTFVLELLVLIWALYLWRKPQFSNISCMPTFTGKLTIFIIISALLTAITLYLKEEASIIQVFTNMGATYRITADEASSLRTAASWYFAILSLPLIPLLICVGKRPWQITIAIFSVITLLLAIFVTPGGDRNGCIECALPILFSVASTIIFSVAASLWIFVASIFIHLRCRDTP